MKREVRVGLLILFAAFVFIVAVFAIGDQEGFWTRKYELRVLYDDVYGLLPGSPVRLNGLRVGTVKDIRFSREHAGKLEVLVRINRSVQDLIRDDSKALIGTLGLLGDKTIEIEAGSQLGKILEAGEYLQPERSSSIEAIVTEGGEAIEDLKHAARHTREIIEKINTGQGSLGLFVNDPNVYFDLDRLLLLAERLTQQLESGEGSFTKFVKDSTFYTELRDLFANTNAFLDSITTGEGTLSRLMRDPKPYEDIRQITSDWREITQRIKAGEGSAGQLLTNDSLFVNFTRALDRAEALLEDFRLNPGRYIRFRIF